MFKRYFIAAAALALLSACNTTQHVFQAGQAAFLQLRLIQHIHRKGQLLHFLAHLPRLHHHGEQRGSFITFCATRPGLSRLGRADPASACKEE